MNVLHLLPRRALMVLLLLAPACSSINNPWETAGDPRTEKEVEAVVAQAEAQLAAGRSDLALEGLRKARRVRGLSPELRNKIDHLTERSAEQRVRELSEPGSNPRDMAELFDLDLPRQIKVTAGIEAARMYLDAGKPKACFRMIEKVDKAYPPAGTHHERVAAGEILARGGLEQIVSKKRGFLGFSSAAGRGERMLEYLVLNYPLQRRCDQAYFALGKRYEKQEHWQLALERHQDLLLYHSGSPLAIKSEAKIPHLRLIALRSPEYDRREMLRARIELETWVAKYGNGQHPELEEKVLLDYADCLGRLVKNDLVVARFYRRIDKTTGARLHADRALEVARVAEDERLIVKVEKLLESLGPEESTWADPAAGPGEPAQP